jgi:hypothetical protein
MAGGFDFINLNVSPADDYPLTSIMATEERLVGKFLSEFNFFRLRRQYQEDIMLRSLRNFNGIYGPEVQFEEHSSDLFVKFTSHEVTKGIAKVLKFVRPITGKPWDIMPTEVPENSDGSPQDIHDAFKKSQNMSRQIQDDLDEMDFKKKLHRGGLDHALFGTMILYGPVGLPPRKPKWRNDDGNWSLEIDTPAYLRPNYEYVNVWDFYPDPDAIEPEDMLAAYVRLVLNTSQFRALKNDPNFKADVIDKILNEHPTGNWTAERWESQIQIAVENRWAKTNRYIVLRRTGIISGAELKELGEEVNDEDLQIEYMTNVWICAGEVIRAQIMEFNSRRIPFVVCPWRKVPGKLWGCGVAESMEDSQGACNSSARAIIDNMAMSCGPNVVIDTSQIVPGTNITSITPRKIWPIRFSDAANKNKPLDFFVPPSVLADLQNVFKMFRELISEQTGIPDVTRFQEQAGSGVRTTGQTSIYYTQAEEFIKLVIGNLDTYYFEVIIRGIYDWEMTFNPNTDIKGDFNVKAMGVAGAMAREVLAQKLMEYANFLSKPPFNLKIDVDVLTDMVFETMDMVNQGIIMSDDKMKENQEKSAKMAAMEEDLKKISEHKFKAETTKGDALVQLAKGMDQTCIAWAPAMEQAYEAFGAMTPQLYAALNIHLKMLENQFAQMGLVSPENAQALAQPLAAEKPTDLDSDFRSAFNNMPPPQNTSMPQSKLPGMDMPEMVSGKPPISPMPSQGLPNAQSGI